MVVTRCMCCGRAMRPSGSRSWSICLFISLAAGSVRNMYHTEYRDPIMGERAPSCQTLRKGVFGAGAAFIVFTGITSELNYGRGAGAAQDAQEASTHKKDQQSYNIERKKMGEMWNYTKERKLERCTNVAESVSHLYRHCKLEELWNMRD
ncbi:hypothetical protein JHK85_044316 [Glycine max]|nr:hypothetical protein JHK85_044316 [Glycine max]